MRVAALLLIFAVGTMWAAESLEKQADRAVDRADQLSRGLKADYDAGKWQASIEEIASSVENCSNLLKESGKSGRKSPKYFKRAELKTREIARRLDNFSKDVSVDDREPVEKALARVQKVHDGLLAEIMGTK